MLPGFGINFPAKIAKIGDFLDGFFCFYKDFLVKRTKIKSLG